MAFKINVSQKGKTFHIESESKALVDKKLHDKIKGKEVSPDLEGYEFEITGASDKSGFTAVSDVEGVGLKKVLLGYGKGMKKRPKKEGKKKHSNPKPKGLRLRKTVRGNVISSAISQINLKVIKEGSKKLEEIFPDQTQGKTKENRKTKRAQAQKEKQEKPEEEVKEEKAEEKVEEQPKEEVKEEVSEEKAEEKIQENSENKEE